MNRKKKERIASPSFPPNLRRARATANRPEKKRSAVESQKRLKRIAQAVARFLGTLLTTAAVVWVGIAAYRHATTSKYFAADDFQVFGINRLKEVEILKTADIPRGTNIFKVDRERSKRLLENHPWVARARVERRLPRTVQIEIEERHARAVVFFDVPYLVDESGEVFKRWARGDPIPTPLLTGFTREQFIDDPESIRETIREVLALDDRYRSAGLAKVAPLSEIHNEIDGSFSLTLGEEATYVRFGKGPFRRKIEQLAVLLRKLRSEGQSPQMIYFDNAIRPGRVTVKLKQSKAEDLPSTKMTPENENEQKRVSKI